MALYLVQHGRSLPRETDPEQGLSAEGVAGVERIAGVAAGYGVKVSRILHSGKKRALETAEIFGRYLEPAGGIEERGGLNPMDDVTSFANRVRSDENFMVVGHLPFMERLTSLLVAGAPEMRVFRFQNGGIVCLDKEPDGRYWFIKWTLMPEIG
jgi:phosphohistidine phosphatase